MSTWGAGGFMIIPLGGLMAASTVMMLPGVILFFLTQRAFIQGITLTGIKG